MDPPAATSLYLQPCGLIDADHPSIVSKAQQLTEGLSNETDKAVAIYKFVKDGVLFGFSPEFDNLPASKVLSDGVGFCNPKSTLFTALLRAAGIPARQHMVSINMNVLEGLGPPTNVYGDHAITEVFLKGRWLKVDSYTVDEALFAAGQKKLQQLPGRVMGYGVHKGGANSWDGQSDSFVQYIMPAGTGVHAAAPSAQAASAPAAAASAAAVTATAATVTATAATGCSPSSSSSMSGPDTSFSGAAAAPDGPMSDRDFGVVPPCSDLRGAYFPMVSSSSPFAWQRSWWGRQLFRLAAAYCNARVAAARAGRL